MLSKFINQSLHMQPILRIKFPTIEITNNFFAVHLISPIIYIEEFFQIQFQLMIFFIMSRVFSQLNKILSLRLKKGLKKKKKNK